MINNHGKKIILSVKAKLHNSVEVMAFVALKTKKVICDCGGRIKPKIRNGRQAFTPIMIYWLVGRTAH